MRGEGRATSLREGGGGVSFGRKGGDVLFSEGRREGVLFLVGRGLLSFIWRRDNWIWSPVGKGTQKEVGEG